PLARARLCFAHAPVRRVLRWLAAMDDLHHLGNPRPQQGVVQGFGSVRAGGRIGRGRRGIRAVSRRGHWGPRVGSTGPKAQRKLILEEAIRHAGMETLASWALLAQRI